MGQVGGTTRAQVSPWIFWGGMAACLAIIIGLWAFTLPLQWSLAEVDQADPPRWTLLDAGDPAGRLKSQIVEVKEDFVQTKEAWLNLPVQIEQAERFRAAGQTITNQLETQTVITAPDPVTETDPEVTPSLTPTP